MIRAMRSPRPSTAIAMPIGGDHPLMLHLNISPFSMGGADMSTRRKAIPLAVIATAGATLGNLSDIKGMKNAAPSRRGMTYISIRIIWRGWVKFILERGCYSLKSALPTSVFNPPSNNKQLLCSGFALKFIFPNYDYAKESI